MQFLLFRTEGGNQYLYSPKRNKFLLVHPVSYYLLDLYKKGIDLKKYISDLKHTGLKIVGYGKCTKKELRYHLNKIEFLEKNLFLAGLDSEKELSLRLKAEDIKKSLANTNSCTLEVTQNCCLNCVYCAYGKLYQDFEKREKRELEFSIAKEFLDYLLALWNSPLNYSHNKQISFGFYGGEPFLNFSLIKSLVKYLMEKQKSHIDFAFHITTNGIFLNKYIDFLAEFDFDVLVSLDGDKESNAYRTFPDGNSSYPSVLDNITYIRDKYPEYFKKKISFNAVLHNRNSKSEIYEYFMTNFEKIPNVSSIAPIGINASEKNNFLSIYKSFNEPSDENNYKDTFERDALLGKYEKLSNLLHTHSGYIYKKYEKLDYTRDGYEEVKTRIPGGTCIPFSRKIFLTAKGTILPCERIGHQFSLGFVNAKGVFLDFEAIADKYNAYFENIFPMCARCYNNRQCDYCFFHLDSTATGFKCDAFMDYHDYCEYLSRSFSLLEGNPGLYKKIMKGNVWI